jgi:hypothetical protein
MDWSEILLIKKLAIKATTTKTQGNRRKKKGGVLFDLMD